MLDYLFNLEHVLFMIGDYAVSPLEAWATLTGLVCVILARMNKVSNFYIGLINCVGFGALFYQIQLYSDMLLQGYFILMSLYGIYIWSKKDDSKIHYGKSTEDAVKIRWMTGPSWSATLLCIAMATLLLGSGIDDLFSFIGTGVASIIGTTYVHIPAELPYRDAFTTVASIVAFGLMANRYVESWILWVAVNVGCIYNYYTQGVMVVTVEYIVFLINALWAFGSWASVANKDSKVFK